MLSATCLAVKITNQEAYASAPQKMAKEEWDKFHEVDQHIVDNFEEMVSLSTDFYQLANIYERTAELTAVPLTENFSNFEDKLIAIKDDLDDIHYEYTDQACFDTAI
jgi:hypothetical protein